MTDERYVFVQDQKERRRAASGAKYKKGSRGGHSCRLATDHMTRKEWEKMNGEPITMKPGSFLTYEEFKKLTPNLKVEWINSIIDRYDVSLSSISTIMFGRAENTLYSYMYYTNKDSVKRLHTRMGPTNKDALRAFREAIREWKGETIVEEPKKQDEEPNYIPVEAPVEEPVQETKKQWMKTMSFEFTSIDDDFVAFIKSVCADRKVHGHVAIIFEEDNE